MLKLKLLKLKYIFKFLNFIKQYNAGTGKNIDKPSVHLSVLQYYIELLHEDIYIFLNMNEKLPQ